MQSSCQVSTGGGIGRLTLNRPRSINALDLATVAHIDNQLRLWEADNDVEVVVIDGSGTRGMCAGGDVRLLRESALTGGEEARTFLRTEYQMNARIHSYGKPVVAVMHGLVLGGGVGLGAHASVRLVTETTRMGMPEVAIGFVPDVGGAWLMSRAPGEVGTHLVLTAGSVGAADALLCGLADLYVNAATVAGVRTAPTANALFDAIESARRSPATPTQPSELLADRAWIDDCYTADSVGAVVDGLRSTTEPRAHAAATAIESSSPTALQVSLQLLRRCRGADNLEQSLRWEYRAASAALADHDFSEGVRAQLVDKDRRPVWRPAELAGVQPWVVDTYFCAPEAGDLKFSHA